MDGVAETRPVWSADASLSAIWVAAGVSPESIASRCDASLQGLHEIFAVEHWETPEGKRWDGPHPLPSAREPWIVAVEHECQNPGFIPPSPEHVPIQDDSYRM